MRSGGFPCRFVSCRVIFTAKDGSLAVLQMASAQRTEHELAVHGYRHVRLDEERRGLPWTARRPQPPKA